METNFNKLAPSIQAKILESIERVNSQIGDTPPEKLPLNFTVEDDATEKKMVLKLVDAEDGAKKYEFDYLAW